MGNWHKVEGPDPAYPCTNCQAGSSSISSYLDPNGDFWTKSDDCSETCERLKEYHAPQHGDRLFGENIRDAYAAITGKDRARAKQSYPPIRRCDCGHCLGLAEKMR